MHERTTAAALDPSTLPDRYTSKLDLATSGGNSAKTERTLRALGYLSQLPMISQRVVNETAQTLSEIEQRSPRSDVRSSSSECFPQVGPWRNVPASYR
jgi:hypothetical protein